MIILKFYFSTITYDSFVRAGVESVSVGVDVDSYATCTRGVKIIPDKLLSDLSDDDLRSFDIVIIPGGAKGANTLKDNKRVQHLLSDTYEKSGKFIGTICAGSLAVKTSNIANGKRITSHPSVKSDLEKGLLLLILLLAFNFLIIYIDYDYLINSLMWKRLIDNLLLIRLNYQDY